MQHGTNKSALGLNVHGACVLWVYLMKSQLGSKILTEPVEFSGADLHVCLLLLHLSFASFTTT